MAQKQLAADLAHDLRTPLSILKINLELALLDPKLDPQLQKSLRANMEELDRMAKIINDFQKENR